MKYLWASSPGLTDFPVPLIPGPLIQLSSEGVLGQCCNSPASFERYNVFTVRQATVSCHLLCQMPGFSTFERVSDFKSSQNHGYYVGVSRP